MSIGRKSGLTVEMGIAFKHEPWRNLTFFVDLNNPIPKIEQARKEFLNRYAKFREKDELDLYFKVPVLSDSGNTEKIFYHLHDLVDEKRDMRPTFNLSEQSLAERKQYLLQEFYEVYDKIREKIYLNRASEDSARRATLTLINGGVK